MEESSFTLILREHLREKNITALAKEIGAPSTLIHDWVQGRRLPSLKNIKFVKKIADHLGLTLEELLIGTVSASKENRTITNLTFDDAGRSYEVRILRKEK